MDTPCPANAILYNVTRCLCAPGHYMPSNSTTCELFVVPPGGELTEKSVTGEEPSFWTSVFPFDSFKRFTQSPALFFEITAIVLVSWLAFCTVVRVGKLNGGKSIWFRIRWWISRLDICYATRHWLDDRKVVTKRRTELGGTFSIASLILFLGLLSSLLYQIFTKRTVELHNIKPSNGPDFHSLENNMELNVTAVSSMSCSHLRDLGTLVTGNPGSIDFRISKLSTLANHSCHNTSEGPTVTIKCIRCRVPPRNFYISWKFVDLPNDPAAAVAFMFNVTSRDHRNDKRISYVSATVMSGTYSTDAPKTFRGPGAPNVLMIRLFPLRYYNLHNLSIIQPIFHDFLPGSYFSDRDKLQASLQNSYDGSLNITLFITSLSDYIIEIKDQKILGSVSSIASIGGLYAFCFAIFLYFLLQCEFRFKRLRNEDIVFWNTISRNRARRNWNKLRKYVMYTWGPRNLEGNDNNGRQHGSGIVESFSGMSSLHKRKRIREDSIYMNKTDNSSPLTITFPDVSTKKVVVQPSSSNPNFDDTSLNSESATSDGGIGKSQGERGREHG